ncbi:AraC family transcriptional regulator ligand-binding domain-containing protein [Rhodococcus qingshengii]
MAEVTPLLSGFPQIRLERRCDTTTTTVCVELRPEIRGHETRVDNPINRLLIAFVLIFLHRFSAWLIGHRLKPVTVQLPFPEPDQTVRTQLRLGLRYSRQLRCHQGRNGVRESGACRPDRPDRGITRRITTRLFSTCLH